MTITLQALSLVEKAETVQVRFTLYARGTKGVRECKMDVKVYTDSYMELNRSCFMVIWIIFKNHLLKVGQTQNQETMTLRTLTAVGWFYSIMCEDLHEQKLIQIAFGRGPGHI